MAASLPIWNQLDFEELTKTYLTKKNVVRACSVSRYIILGALFLLMSYTVWFTVDNSLSPSPQIEKILLTVQRGAVSDTSSIQDADPSRTALTRKDTRIIRETKLFGAAIKKVTPVKVEKEEKVVAPLNVALIGTFVSSGNSSIAIIEDKKAKTQEVFNIGQEVFGQGTLAKVSENSVDLKRNGQIETLTIDDSPPSADADTPAPPGAEEKIVDSEELESALDNLPLLLTQARAVPYFKQGKSVGLRLFAIKTGSLYEKIGLKNGDILKSIDGKNLGDFSQAMKLFEQLRDQQSLTLSLERNRQEKVFHYKIQ